ncbi:MAG: thiamine pyrophosphate-binding protein [Candidatus Nanopelagicales bacterium]
MNILEELRMQKLTKTGAELVQDFVSVNEIEYVFGCPGTTETTFLAALAESKAKYVLGLTEPVVVGMAAGYSIATGSTAMVSLHTYPGLASGMFNIRNAQLAGVPLFIVNGTEDSHFLIHNPVLGGPNTQLAATATKYQYEVSNIDELTVAMQRCWTQAGLQPTQPVFLSVPMDFMQGSTERVTFKKTQIFDDAASASIGKVAEALSSAKKLAIVTDYAVGWDDAVRGVTNLAVALGADIWAPPFHVQGACDMLHPTFKGSLPLTTTDVRDVLNEYDTVLLLGEKIDTFTYTGDQAVPPELTLIQVTPATQQLGFDWPVDIGVVGDIKATVDALAKALDFDPDAEILGSDEPADMAALQAKYPASGPHASDALILSVLQALDTQNAHVVTEGSSEDGLVQEMAVSMGFRNVYFSPRGGGLGWAMPVSVGLTLAGKQAVCFVGDGGSMFSLPAIWSAAAMKLPVVFVVAVNHEYRLLKDLWVSFMNTDFDSTQFVGLDFNDPSLDLDSILRGFGATTVSPVDAAEVKAVMAEAKNREGPTVVFINRER